MKRFLAVLTALTMLVSMFNIVAFATGEEVSPLGATTTVAGGKWANPLVKENITVNTVDSTGTISVSGNAMTYTPVDTSGTKNISSRVSLAGEAWKNTGSAEICATVSYGGTLNAGDRFAMNIAFTSYDAGNARQWVTGAPSFEKDFTFAAGETRNIKWVVEFGETNLVTHEYIKAPDEDEWTYVRTVTKVGPTDEAYKKINEVYPYGQFNYQKGNTSGAYAVFSDFAVRELYNVAKLENITDSYDMINDDFADISYIVPSNYDKAKLTVGGKVFAEFDSDTDDYGAYKTSVDLTSLPYFGILPVELVVTDNNGSVITKSTTLNVTNPNDRELIAYDDFDGNTACTYGSLAFTASHVKPNGKSGNGLAISNVTDADSEMFATVAGGANNSIQINNLNNLDGYVYDIEFDIYQISADGTRGGKSGTIVKNYYFNGTTNVSGWKTGGWSFIQDHTQIAGTAGKYQLGEWVSLKYTVDTANDTISAYNLATGELLGSRAYVNDGVNYIGLGYVVYDAVPAYIRVDNVKFYRYLPGNKTGITSVAVDPVTKAVSITADTALSAENVTDTNVTLTANGNARTATVALGEDGKTIIVTPSSASALGGKDAVVTLAPAVIGYGITIPVSYVAEYSNRKITADEATSKVTASVDIIADAAGENAGIMYIAYYKNGNLVHAYKTDVVTTAAGLGTFTANYTPEERVDYDTVKTFVWNSSNTPLLKVYSK